MFVAGWSYQWLSQLNFAPDSWTAAVDAMRVAPSEDATDATVAQVTRVTEMLPESYPVPIFVFDVVVCPPGEVTSLPESYPVPIFVFDAGYDPVALTVGLVLGLAVASDLIPPRKKRRTLSVNRRGAPSGAPRRAQP